ncbi:SprT family zinc-dependent metalloprotease [Thalassotalea psychrophila]|uniref:SprT family zinc-dependent metalloprotease n=1 Tax=Thalassotalea psychrophila TaxID=3065647 RepID=A0ABY9TXD9_9GAMM|nr:SprT family zinc-dependent metalloprotease [Colwelliaceae bacterium SQ149]
MSVLEYQLVRSSKRKTVSLQVKAGKVRVLAPMKLAEQYINDIVREKSPWLQLKITEQLNHFENQYVREYQAGEIYYYQGKRYTLLIERAETTGVLIVDNTIVISLKNLDIHKVELGHQVKKVLHAWYVNEAKQLLSNRFEVQCNHTKLNASSLKIRYYKSRWGSCDAKQRINLNWLLVMAPIEVIDYVIIHELCHTIHLNHSSKYWQLVSELYPNFKQAKAWLKQHQQHLYWQN